MSAAKAVSFRVQWDDGSVWTAEGKTAEEVMRWYQSCEAMYCLRGAQYSGPKITIAPAPTSESKAQK